MITRWETATERLLRHMRVPPKQKLLWLQNQLRFLARASSKETLRLRRQLRQTPRG